MRPMLIPVLAAILLLCGCGTSAVISGHDYEAVWFAAKDVMSEIDAHAIFDRDRGRQLSESYEEPWYWNAARWLTLGAFGTTGDRLRIRLAPEEGGAVRVEVRSTRDMVAAYFPVFWHRGSVEADVLSRIEARLASPDP